MTLPDNVKKPDANNRVTIPADCRKQIGMYHGDFAEIFTEEDRIVLKKYIRNRKKCAFCESQEDLWAYREQFVCDKCCEGMEKLREEQKLIPLKARTRSSFTSHNKRE